MEQHPRHAGDVVVGTPRIVGNEHIVHPDVRIGRCVFAYPLAGLAVLRGRERARKVKRPCADRQDAECREQHEGAQAPVHEFTPACGDEKHAAEHRDQCETHAVAPAQERVDEGEQEQQWYLTGRKPDQRQRRLTRDKVAGKER